MKPSLKAHYGFTLVELLIGIAVASVLASVGMMTLSGVRETAKDTKLQQDVALINNAITAYVGSGGNLTGVTAADDLFRKLKTRAANAPSVLGPTGSFVDSRLSAVMQSATEAGTSEKRAYFKTDTYPPRFVIASTGGIGIKAFELRDSPLADVAVSTENRHTPIAQNPNTGWIWAESATTASIPPGWANPGITDDGTPPGGNPTIVINPIPLTLSINAPNSLTYEQAGGQIYNQQTGVYLPPQTPAPAKINLSGAFSVSDVNPSNFVLRYTLDGTDPVSSPSVQTANFVAGSPTSVSLPINLTVWNGGTSLTIKAYAKAVNTSRFVSSAVTTAKINAESVQLSWRPEISSFNPVQITGRVLNGPPSTVIRYTINGAEPGLNSPTYTGIFSLPSFIGREDRFVRAKSFPPTSNPAYWAAWFTPTNEQQAKFTGNVGLGDGVGVGVLSTSVWVHDNSIVNGNITFADGASAMPGEAFLFAQTSKINGNMFVPGYPTIHSDRINQDYHWWNDGDFDWHIKGYYYDSNMNPLYVDPPRVYDMPGGSITNPYTIVLKDEFQIKGKIIRGWTPPKMPTVPDPGSKNNNNLYPSTSGIVDPSQYARVKLETNGTLTLLPGNYGNVLASGGGTLILGDASNPDNTQYYSFESFEAYTNANIQIVGKVQITVKYNGSPVQVNSGATMGNAAHPDWLQLNVYSSAGANVNTDHVIIGYGGKFYGSIVAPKGRVFIRDNAQFVGGIAAYRTQIVNVVGQDNLKFVLSPVSGN